MWPWRRHPRGLPPDRVESPEQLDSVLSLINPRVWVAHGVLLTSVVIGVVWAFFGSVTVSRSMIGSVLSDRPPVGVIVRESGVLTELLAQGGERVRRQQPLARFQLPELNAQIAGLRTRLESLRLESARIEEFDQREDAIRSGNEQDRLVALEQELSGLSEVSTPESSRRAAQITAEIRAIRDAGVLRTLALERSRFQRRMAAESLEAEIDRLSRRVAEGVELRSPIDGTLGGVSLEAGPVPSGRAIAWVYPDAANSGVLRVRVELTPEDAEGIDLGAPVSIVLEDAVGGGSQLRLRGAVAALIPKVGDAGCVLDVRAELPSQEAGAGFGASPGSTCTLHVEIDRRRPIHVLFPPEDQRAR